MKRISLLVFIGLLCALSLVILGCGSGGSAPQQKPTVLQPNVNVLSQEQANTQISSVTDTTVVMQQGTPAYHTGDVIVSDTDDGLLRQVTGITSNPDGTTTLQTQQAALTDVFQSVEVHQQFIIKPEDVKSFTPKTRGVTLRTQVPASRADMTLFTHEIDLDVPIAGDGALALQGSVGVGLKLNFDLVIENGQLQAFQLAIEADANAKIALNATGDLKIPLSHLEKDLATIQFAAITIWVPTPVGVPAPIKFDFNMVPYVFDDSTFTTTGTVKLVELSASLKLQGGVRINSNLTAQPITSATVSTPALTGLLPDLAAIDPHDANAMQPLTAVLQNTDLQFKVDNTLGLGARFECKLYGVVGPYVKLEVIEHQASAALNVNTQDPSIVFDNLIRCRPLQSAGVRLDIFNKKLIDVSVDAQQCPVAFETHITPFPITIPLSGSVEPTVN